MIGWFIVPYKLAIRNGKVAFRYCEIIDYTVEIRAAGGKWMESEVLGNRAVVKVRAPEAIITVLSTKYKRLPKDRLDDPLSDLPVAVRTALKNELKDMGYTVAEIAEKLPNDIGTYTLRDVLKFMTTKRKATIYNADQTDVLFDVNVDQPCRRLELLDESVVE